MPRTLSLKIRCHTHLLTEDAFNGLKQQDTYINISSIQKDKLVLEISDVRDPLIDDNAFITKAHAIINFYLVSLNVCTLGLFLPNEDYYLSRDYEFHDSLNKESERGSVIHNIHTTNLSGSTITEREILNSFHLYGALAREENVELVSEYLKGLVHLNLNYPGTHFEKDAFANFYRVFEHLITNRMLEQRKLKNELKQILDALSSAGLSSDTKNEFKELYAIRGSQAMHAQLPPRRIDRETSMKMKIFADVVFFHVYKPVWENFNNALILQMDCNQVAR